MTSFRNRVSVLRIAGLMVKGFQYNYLIVLGGRDLSSLRSTEIYNINDDSYIEGPDLPNAKAGACGTMRFKTNQIYIIGGYQSITSFDTGTEIFDISSREFLPPVSSQLAFGRAHPACSVLEEDDILIAAGGVYDGWNEQSSVEILNLSTETWSLAEPIPEKKTVWTFAEDFIFTSGLPFYQYEPRSDIWLEIENVPFAAEALAENTLVLDASDGNPCRFT